MKKIIFLLMMCSIFIISVSADAHKKAAAPRLRSSLQVSGDPWIFNAYKELYSRQPNALEVNIHNYNNGSWTSYPQLKQYVQDFQNALHSQNIIILLGPTKNGQTIVGLDINGQLAAASIVAQGGGNIVAQGGGNIVAQGGGNLVGPSGGTFKVSTTTAGFSIGSSMGIQSVGTRRISTSPGSAFIIK